MVNDRPPSALTTWIRANLVVASFLCMLVSAAVGGLIAATASVTTIQIKVEDSAGKIVVLQGNIVSVNDRLIAIVQKEREAEADIDQRLTAAHEKVALLEQVLATIADRTAREPLTRPKGDGK